MFFLQCCKQEQNFPEGNVFQKNSMQSQARRLVHNSAYCWETQLFSSLNCWRQAHAIEIERVLQHSAYALACCWHFCMAACFIRNMKAAKLISTSKKSVLTSESNELKSSLCKLSCSQSELPSVLRARGQCNDDSCKQYLPRPLSTQAPQHPELA